MSLTKVENITFLTDETYILIFLRRGLEFKAGQYVSVSFEDDPHSRRYAFYSGENDDTLEFLIREVAGGYLTPQLKKITIGDTVDIDRPMGKFLFDENHMDSKVVFVATGTGIAPFRSMIRTYPNIDYTIVHGIRYGTETYGKDEYPTNRYISCTSQDGKGDYHGRVTDYIQNTDFQQNTHFYLCGSSTMVSDVLDILKKKGFSSDKIHREVFF